MFNYETLWDVYETKFLLLFISAIVAVWLGNWIYDETKDDNK